ncbi:MAG: hypothetical protein ACYTEZ_08480 [Planctomycetota bacterium]
MILFAAAGLAGDYLLGWRMALPVMILLGLIVAPLVPARSSCSVPPRETADEEREQKTPV